MIPRFEHGFAFVNADGGIVLKLFLLRKPLWFSEARIALALNSQYTSVESTIAEELGKTSVAAATKSRLTSEASISGGMGYSVEDAIMRAIGEGLERFCAQMTDASKHSFVRGSHNLLSRKYNAFPLDRYHQMSTQQSSQHAAVHQAQEGEPWHLVNLDPDAELDWLLLPEIGSTERWLVPSIACFMGIGKLKWQELILEPMSTGIACHSSLDAALLNGLCEVIERDAFQGMWLSRLSPPKVDLNKCEWRNIETFTIIKEFTRTKFQITVNDLTSDIGVPVYLATLINDDVPYSMLGAGCHPDPEIAMCKSLMEVLMGLSNAARTPEEIAQEDVAPLTDNTIETMEDHAKLYYDNDLRDRLKFYLENADTVIPCVQNGNRSSAELLSETVLKLKKAGYTAVFNDLTIPEVRQYGLSVVKVFVPGLLPLNCSEACRPLGAARLAEFDNIYKRHHQFGESINPWPHPFP